MAITAAMTVSSATATSGQTITATCTVSNSGGSAVNVLSIQPTCTVTTLTPQSVGVSLGIPNTGPGMTLSVAASGTTAFNWGVTAHAPQPGHLTSPNPANPASITYDIGATVYTADGSTTAASTTTLAVTAPTH